MDINYDELFGLEAAETTDNTTAETAAQPETEPAQPEAKPETQPAEKPAEKPAEPTEEQTREERSRQAMARRLREAEERAAKAERERASELLARLTLEDPDTGERVDTLEKLEAYDRKQSEKRMQSGSPTEADIRRVIREEREKAAQPPQPQVDPQVQAQLEQIARMDPAMTDIGKILESDIGQAFRGFVGAGDDFVTAFYKARTQQAQIPAKAAEAARLKAAGKEHLGKTQSLGTEEIPVPRDEMAQFRVFFPDASEAEIRKYYNADRKKYGPK